MSHEDFRRKELEMIGVKCKSFSSSSSGHQPRECPGICLPTMPFPGIPPSKFLLPNSFKNDGMIFVIHMHIHYKYIHSHLHF